MRYFLYTLPFIFLLAACQQEELPLPKQETPVFFLQGNLDNTSINMEAGKDEYYMYTSFEQDPDGVYVFESRMQRTICQPEIPCPERLRIVIRDYQVSQAGSAVDPEASFPMGRYPFAENIALPAAAYFVSFSAEGPEDTDLSYNWDFGDGTSATDANPSHEYLNRDDYRVCLEIADANGQSSKICNELSLRPGECQANFSHELLAQYGNYVQYRSSSVGDIPIKYNWDFGDGIQATLSNPGYFYAESGVYETCLTVVDSDGCRSRLCKNIAANSDELASSFTYTVAETAIPRDTLQLGAVAISWTDESGVVYRSDRLRQNGESFFEVLAAEPWEANENGEQTYRLRIRMNCQLRGNGQTRKLQNVSGFIAVAYPD